MLESLISSKMRIKLLMRFFLNQNSEGYLRGLESEMGDSSNAIRVELNNMEQSGLLTSFTNGNKKFFKANIGHPLFRDIQSILQKYLGIDKIIENVIERLGDVRKVFITGSFARGQDSPVIDLVILGSVDKKYLIQLIDKVEKLIHRKIRYLIFEDEKELIEAGVLNSKQDSLLIWENELPVSSSTKNNLN
jgi:predicted nucleotidyltransferase